MFTRFLQFLRKIFSSRDSLDTLYVGNLIYSATNSDLRELFSKVGPIVNTRIIRDSRTRKSKGYGFVTFKSAKLAREALSFEGQNIKGRPIRVRIANGTTRED